VVPSSLAVGASGVAAARTPEAVANNSQEVAAVVVNMTLAVAEGVLVVVLAVLGGRTTTSLPGTGTLPSTLRLIGSFWKRSISTV
jgi:hypothetical protein